MHKLEIVTIEPATHGLLTCSSLDNDITFINFVINWKYYYIEKQIRKYSTLLCRAEFVRESRFPARCIPLQCDREIDSYAFRYD